MRASEVEKHFVIAIKLATLELQLDNLVGLEVRDWQDQPRVPRGSDRGGEWMAVGGAPRDGKPLKVAFGAVLMSKRRYQSPMLGSAMKCFYRDMLDRWFAISVGIEKECPPTYPADPIE